MACTYTYQGKSYSASEFDDVLRTMSPSVAAKYMTGVSPVPDAPMVGDTKSWVALGIKRAIRHAVDVGADGVVFGTGQQNADLYDLSKYISSVAWRGGDLRAWDLDGEEVMALTGISKEETANLIGKEVAERLFNQEPKGEGRNALYHLGGLDLKVGGEGMAEFYGNENGKKQNGETSIVPSVANEVLKKLQGGKVATVETEGGKQPGFPITDEMRAQVRQGLPLFAKATSRNQGGSRQAPLPGTQPNPPARPPIQATVNLQGGAPGNRASFNTPDESIFDNKIFKYQDKHIDLKRVIAEIKQAGTVLADKWDPYLQEELFHNRAAKRVKDFSDREMIPLLNFMLAGKVSIEDLDIYLWARHAHEANELIRNRDPNMQDGGSGLTDAQATDLLSGRDVVAHGAILKGVDQSRLVQLRTTAAMVDTIIAKTRNVYVSYGLEGRDVVDGWADMFKHYVPLMREDHDGAMGIGQGFSIKGREVKHRTGSTKSVSDIFANIAIQRERAIVRGEKNRVAVALAGLVKMNPNPDFWAFDKIPHEVIYNPSTGLNETREVPGYRNRDNVIVAKIKDSNGNIHERVIVLNEHNDRAMRLALAMKNMDAAALEGWLATSAKITRYFAAINTQYNPVFGVKNLIRDIGTAVLNLSSTPLADRRLEVMSHVASALAGIYSDARAIRKGNPATSGWAHLWEEFGLEGGPTGFRQMFSNSTERVENLHAIMNPEHWMEGKWGQFFTAGGALKVPLSALQKLATPLFNWLTDYNLAMENAVRLSAYRVALNPDEKVYAQQIKNGATHELALSVATNNYTRGMSKQRAASLAKNLTVNFNRKGSQGQQAGALYAFFNASMQGTARMAETMMDRDTVTGKYSLSKAGMQIAAGGMLLGVLQAIALAAAGFDDDEPPEFVRERNIIIPVGNKKYISIPMPLGFHVIPNIGRIATEAMIYGGKDVLGSGINLIGIVLDAFNPIGSAGLTMQTIAPTALDPAAAIMQNVDWTGKPIARKDFSSLHQTPGFTRAKDTATGFSVAIAKAIHYATGGTDYTPGKHGISPTPDQIDYLIGQVTGGVGREGIKLVNTATAIATGEELPTYKRFLVGGFYGDAGQQSSQASKFYQNLKELNAHQDELLGRAKNEGGSEAMSYLRRHPDAALYRAGDRAESKIRELRKVKRKAIDSGATKDQVRKIEDDISKVMTRFNATVKSAQETARP